MPIRRMERGDLDAADALLRAAFQLERSFLPRLQRYVALEPDGWLVATDDATEGALAGTVGTLSYGRFAYVGLMAVAPAVQSRGVGRRLLEAALASLERRGVGCAVLDATAAGAPLYQKLGFVDAGVTYDYVRQGGDGGEGDPSPRGALAADVTTAAAVDRRCFGADRAPLWRRLAGEGFSLWTEEGAHGAQGALTLQPGQIGPWVADDADVAASLLGRALAAVPRGTPVRVQVPGDASPAAHELLLGAGFGLRKTLRHMRRGDLTQVPPWTKVYGKGSYCLG